MSTLTVTPTYADGNVLYESELDAVNTSIQDHFNNANVEGSNLQAGVIGVNKIANTAITTAKINDSAVTTAKLEDSTGASDGITTAKINDSAVTTAKLFTSTSSSNGITTAKIADSAVTTAKIASNAVPKSVMLLPYYSTTSIADGTTTGTICTVNATGLTTGKPVVLLLESSSTSAGSGSIKCAEINFRRDGTNIANYIAAIVMQSSGTTTPTLPPSSYMYIDTPSSTSHTYTVYAASSCTTSSCQLKIMQVL